MKAPDKIYIPLYPNHDLDGFHPADEWMYEPHKEVENVEYIREDISNEAIQVAEDHAYLAGQEKFREKLLKWAEEEMMKAARSSEAYGRRNAFMDVIDKINSL